MQRCVPAVLAMQFPISDPAAIALSREFYSALADGYPIDAALSEARKADQEAGGPLEWGTPVLFSRSDDNRLIEMPRRRRPAGHRAPDMGAGDDPDRRRPVPDGQQFRRGHP